MSVMQRNKNNDWESGFLITGGNSQKAHTTMNLGKQNKQNKQTAELWMVYVLVFLSVLPFYYLLGVALCESV